MVGWWMGMGMGGCAFKRAQMRACASALERPCVLAVLVVLAVFGVEVMGMNLFCDGCASHHLPPLEHQSAKPGACKVGCRDESVMTAANDDGVVLARTRR